MVAAFGIVVAAALDAVAYFLPGGSQPQPMHVATASALLAGYLAGRAWTIAARAIRSPHVDLEHP